MMIKKEKKYKNTYTKKKKNTDINTYKSKSERTNLDPIINKILNAKTFYDVLDISKKASKTEILSAYQQSKNIIYPNLIYPKANQAYTRLFDAYDILSDPIQKESYDLHLKFSQYLSSDDIIKTISKDY